MEFFKDLENAMNYLSTTGAFLTVKNNETVNTMTIAWGFVGFMWKKPYFVTMVRPQRFTNDILEVSDNFTISIPYGTMKKELGICGSKSGRDIDKSEIVKFVPAKKVQAPIVEGCNIYYECKVNYVDKLKESSIPNEVIETWYDKDYHNLFFGEIVDLYKR